MFNSRRFRFINSVKIDASNKMAIAIENCVESSNEDDFSLIDPEDEILKILCNKIHLRLHGRGSDLKEGELKRLIDEQIPRLRIPHRTLYQFAEIRTHQYLLSERLGHHVSADDAAYSWIGEGHAKKFETSYPEQLEKLRIAA